MFQKLTLVRRRALMLSLVAALVAALLPAAVFAAPDASASSSAYTTVRYQPRPRYDRHDRFDRHDRYDRHDKHSDVKKGKRCETTYRVRKGDNLTKISRHFRVSIHALMKANNIRNPNRILAGQTLCIP